MWRTGSSFDGEGFSLSDPKLYRLLEETDGQPIELDRSAARSRALCGGITATNGAMSDADQPDPGRSAHLPLGVPRRCGISSHSMVDLIPRPNMRLLPAA